MRISYGKLDIPVYMHQPTDSSQCEARPGMVCRLEKSIYGLKQAGNIWGSVMHSTLIQWGFRTSNFDPRLYMYKDNADFILIAIVVDDMAFASNNTRLLRDLKQKLQAEFDDRSSVNCDPLSDGTSKEPLPVSRSISRHIFTRFSASTG